jgi:hypothetical protein
LGFTKLASFLPSFREMPHSEVLLNLGSSFVLCSDSFLAPTPQGGISLSLCKSLCQQQVLSRTTILSAVSPCKILLRFSKPLRLHPPPAPRVWRGGGVSFGWSGFELVLGFACGVRVLNPLWLSPLSIGIHSHTSSLPYESNKEVGWGGMDFSALSRIKNTE